MRHLLYRLTLAGLLATTFLGMQAHAAQPEPIDKRVDRIEKELRAVQRKVFPGGTPVEPDITAAPAATLPPSSTPLADLIARVTTIESQLATLTGQVEQKNYKIRQVEDRLDKMQADAAAAAAPPVVTPPQLSAAPASASVAPQPASPPTEARKAAVAAIDRPDTGNPANDSYAYGYRLWEAKFYPEAQTQLKATVDKYGDGPFGSRAQNLLGRAYLDDGKPALASVAFYENYQKRPNGDRAAQSLAYLGESLIQLNKPKDACKVYDELQQSYGSSLAGDLRSMMEKGRARAKCGR